jgi:NAD(P)-dependent dehydrogenase (short-subunit alcohol dehydrogenase family)
MYVMFVMFYVVDGCNVILYSGIGASIATYLARDGANVVVNYNASAKQANEVVDVINAIGGEKGAGRGVAVKADTTQAAEVDFLFNETKRLFGRIDIVIANTGTLSIYHTITITIASYSQTARITPRYLLPPIPGHAFILY